MALGLLLRALAVLPVLAVLAGARLVERIVGGTSVSATTYPFAVRLMISDGPNDYLCGGSLIANDLVVTAAHCIVEPQMSAPLASESVSVCYGDSTVTGQKCTPALNTTVHPQYNPLILTNDIALIRIAPVATGASVGVVPVYTGKLPENTTLTTMGWGKTDTNAQKLPTTLMATQVKVGSVAVCRQAQPQYRSADGPDVCTVNALTPGQDSCQGDSGSPTVITSGGSVQLAALTSSGVDLSNPGAADCAMPNGLAFYTHVYYFIDFIVSTSGRPQSAFTGTSKSDDKQSDASETSAGATLRHPRAYVAIAALIVAAAAAL